MGAAEVELHESYLTATIPASAGREDEPVIGFLAHVDTSPDASGAGVKPQINGDTISSDGTTLLGADDKAGVAEIMTATEILLAGGVKHGQVRLAFTTDEEIGRGVDGFDVEAFGADFAYTMDGEYLGELEYENFNAAEALITIIGKSAHPGDAKGKMVSALRIAIELDAMLPEDERPELVDGREGFYHLTRLVGTVEHAEMEYIIRDFDSTNFEIRKRALTEAVERVNKGEGMATMDIKDQYYNMYEVMVLCPHIIERAERAMRAVGVEPVIVPARGGTDGARLSYLGLPCPNLFTGGKNFHSLQEKASLTEMRKAVEVIVEICRA